ncbi:MAG: MFS transporter [Leptolyngbya sp. IPPAS B-1204]
MRTFAVIWLGQLISTMGSYMTHFALTLWAWEVIQSATALALIGFFSQLLRIPVTLVAGLIVDRYSRKQLMMLGDSVVALSTIAIGLLYLTGHLQLWHLYLAAMINGGFEQIQSLAYQTSISLLVPPQQLIRANSMDSAVHYSAIILGPALAGFLYQPMGLLGILLIDIVTFAIAIGTLAWATIPQPQPQSNSALDFRFDQLTLGLRTVWKQPNLRALLGITGLFWFFHDLGSAIDDPMILARSEGSAQTLASIAIAAGIGGVTGAILLSLWGGPKRRVNGMLAGFIGAGVSKTVFGLGRSPHIWLPSQVCSSLNFPLLGSSETAIWMEKIAPEIQGRVFAANALVLQGISAIATLVAGPLADQIFEPLLKLEISDNTPSHVLSSAFGAGSGAGMALLYVLCSLFMVLIGSIGFFIDRLKAVEG